MHAIVFTHSEAAARAWQYRIEDLGPAWRCTPAASAEAALIPADVLLLLDGAEGLLRAMREAPPLAPPYLLGEGAPDGPLCSPEELPETLARFRREGRLPALCEKRLPATTDIASALLRTLGTPSRLRAWSFLPEMIALTVVHPPLLRDLSHGLYPLMARRCGMTPAGVERSLRLCVESTWTNGPLPALERFFGASVDPEKGKPTNREFLCRVQERVTLTMGRLMQRV